MAVVQSARSAAAQPQAVGTRKRRIKWGSVIVNVVLGLICLAWTVPTLGLLVSSFRTREDISTTGWWSVVPHQDWVKASEIQLQTGIALDKPLQVAGTTLTDDQLHNGYVLPDGTQVKWANRRSRLVEVDSKQTVSNAHFSTSNYQNVLTGQQYVYTAPDGTKTTEQGDNLSGSFLNTLVIAVPATLIPVAIAAFAAYAFAWLRFPGRRIMFALVVALLVVPLQVALIPILLDYTNLHITGTFLALWLAHTGFGLPLAVYLLFNYISQLPRDLFESAFLDGASPFTVFTRLVLPLSVPALASFAIFQFLWVWNDYLVALILLGSEPGKEVLTMRLANMVGSRGQDWHLLTAGAFISMLVPLIVFFSLQRFFVRGLLAGSTKG
ncbi:MAG: carbohydrate ABC transporter permease [Chloroflexota bacterium]|nr:carbohydrate ABC transporter permease [Chloroflexota bacterium]